jgi:hypothetical protein
LDALLQEIVENTDGLQEIKAEVGPIGDNGAEGGETHEGSEA